MKTRLQLWALAMAFTLLFVSNSYVCDDAFLTFRTIDNFVRGFGMRWNVGERVQVFTSPLHTLALSLPYWIVHDRSPVPNPTRIYFVAMVFSYAVSLLAMVRLALDLGAPRLYWPVFTLLASSQAFMSFTSSGLETPLLYLFLVLFYLAFFRRELGSERDYFWTFLWAALSVVTRLDAALLFLPATCLLIARGYRARGWAIVRPVAAASIPILLWYGFALFYFGSLLPNSYYAKVAGLDVDQSVLSAMGAAYLKIGLVEDPITLVVIAVGVLLSFFGGRTLVAGLSILLYVGYVYHIGGDFMGYRFLAPPFLLSTLVIGHFVKLSSARPAWSVVAVLALLVYGASVPSSPLRAQVDGPKALDVRSYFEGSNLVRWRPGREFPFAKFRSVRDGDICRRLRKTGDRAVLGGGGLASFCAGPRQHRVFPAALADPLLARLTLRVEGAFLPGHVPRPLPAGYMDSIREGRNLVEDGDLKLYYDRVRSLAVDPLSSPDRLRNVLALNFTSARVYSNAYLQADPPLPPGFSRRPSLVERWHGKGSRDRGGS